ncbi:tyrosine-type recombinase/integrase [Paenibacillus vini]|uniref:Tyr recombinase domain-containing protein n=1 Tax=Paenibacillus vini TaxID=1476024 RepID=A0ABQ4MH40_9BACL|nr:tyrosine-type recombinase/integrase [Paenibacillus vini]GIP55308.1 hypothetical protein J42TS3_43430 [Paenibacillus vini]
MLVRKKLFNAGITKVELIENIIMTESNEADILNTFIFLKDTGIIEVNSFEDTEWKYRSEVYNVPFTLVFDLEIHSEFNYLLKAYSIIRIVNRVAPTTITLEINYLKRIINATDAFRAINEYHIMCATLSSPESSRITKTLLMFINFAGLPNKHEIVEACERYSYKKHSNRELPDFHSVMIYDKCIEHFFTQFDSEETIKYLPIWLWWRLTNILPMRPSEFFLLRYNCIEFDNLSNEFWINITRIKEEKRDRTEHEKLNYSKVKIDNATYQFIKQFKNIQEILHVTKTTPEYLLPYSLYQKSNKKSRTVAHNRMDLHVFKIQLKKFHHEVIVKYYGYEECNQIRPGDTRHFAIINMFLQGYNPLSIARMAGHNKIATQENYYNHAVHFAESHIYHLAQQKHENRINEKITNTLLGNKRDVYNNGLQYSYDELQHFRKVEYGYCKDLTPEFPDNCTDNCMSCTLYIFKPAINEQEAAIKNLTEYSCELGNRITQEIENIFKIGKRINTINTIRVEESLLNKSRSLSQLKEAKALVDSFRIEVDSYE